MIGAYIGSPIGGGMAVDPLGPYQYLNVFGYLIQGDCECSIAGRMAVKIVAGNDIVLKLKVFNLDDTEVDYSNITNIEWVLKNAYATPVLSKILSDGIEIAEEIELTLEEFDTSNLIGNYTHEFTLEFYDQSIATVLDNSDLQPATFQVRGE